MEIVYTAFAHEQLRRLPKETRRRIVKKMRWYADQEEPLGFAKHLTAYRAYRFRIGDWRVVCDAKKGTLCVLLVGKRDGVYKEFW